MERAGITTAGSRGATCLVGSGDGISLRRRAFGFSLATWAVEAWVARAGFVARERLTVAFALGREDLWAERPTGTRDFFLPVLPACARDFLALTIQRDISKG